ncbi:MAG: AGE family epimerase/isomerase [Solirubrobacteraceae bacterium]|nr:AGE family epimerase/isomerase [Solirubrobacteraceae bacterium]
MSQPASESITDCIRQTRSWVFDQALPVWSEVGVDGDLGFVEHLTLDGAPAEVGYKRLRVQARQVYVFSHASLLGFAPGLETARGGWSFMRAHGWMSEGGWARRLGREGGVLDDTLDLYDQAFALLAIAWWVRASGETEAIDLADATLDAIDRRLRPAHQLGWASESGPAGELLQNPHMHMLEALIALYETTGGERFLDRARSLVALAETKFYDSRTRTLSEYFAGDWTRAPGTRGEIVEPGHHYEWVWLLHRASAVSPTALQTAESLFGFAERWGFDQRSHLVFDELLSDGHVRKASHRCWPQTEAIKAHLATFERTGSLDLARLTGLASSLHRKYLAPAPRGTWIDQLTADGAADVDKIPTSTLYHLFLAFTELLRLEPELTEIEQTQ